MHEFKGQQAEAIKAAITWLGTNRKSRSQIFRLFGWAGTGKTTIAKEIASHVNGRVLYAALSGKAALVLQKKGCSPSSSVHSLIYKAIQDEKTGKFHYLLNHDSALEGAALLVLDEVSMLNEEISRDAMRFGVPILALGDPFQLPPPEGQGFFTNGRPDFMLTEIHRQAKDNPIIRLSIDVREGRRLESGSYGDSLVIDRHLMDKDHLRSLVLEADQVLCGRNATRHSFNARIRELKGMAGSAPVVGDRVICLRNNRDKGVLNGGLWNIDRVHVGSQSTEMRISSLDMPGVSPTDVKVLNEFWRGEEASVDWKRLRSYQEFSYGYAITCHKSQGSQFDNVVLFDESAVFRESAAQWLYTGITRAAERITVVA